MEGITDTIQGYHLKHEVNEPYEILRTIQTLAGPVSMNPKLSQTPGMNYPHNIGDSSCEISWILALSSQDSLHCGKLTLPVASFMPTTKVKKQRSRTFTGCLTCRGRKVKCDLGRPSCANCNRLQLQCSGYTAGLSWMPTWTLTGDVENEKLEAGYRTRSEILSSMPSPCIKARQQSRRSSC